MIVITSIPVYAILSLVVTPLFKKRLDEKFNAGAETSSFLVESINGVQTVKSFAIEDKFEQKWGELQADYVKASYKTSMLSQTAGSIGQFVQKVFDLMILYFGALHVINGNFTVGQLVAFRMLSGRISGPVLRLGQLWQENRYAVMCGGSMMYVDAVCRGIDELPTISAAIREKAMAIYEEGGLSLLQKTLQRLDPEYYEIVDKNNHKRLVHAIEIIMEAGVPYSSLRTGEVKQRDFRIVKVAINYEREQLFDRINRRVEKMIAEGLEEEARRVYHLRHLNSLNTVGYKEMFAYFDGTMDYETAIARIAKNTRVYAKKQLTWLKKDPTIHYLNPSTAFEELMALI